MGAGSATSGAPAMKRYGRPPRVEWLAVAIYAIWLLLALVGLAYVLAELLAEYRSP